MTTRRSNPYLHVSWLSKALVGDKSCLWAYWFKANNQGYAKAPSDFNSARWQMDHTELPSLHRASERFPAREPPLRSRDQRDSRHHCGPSRQPGRHI